MNDLRLVDCYVVWFPSAHAMVRALLRHRHGQGPAKLYEVDQEPNGQWRVVGLACRG